MPQKISTDSLPWSNALKDSSGAFRQLTSQNSELVKSIVGQLGIHLKSFKKAVDNKSDSKPVQQANKRVTEAVNRLDKTVNKLTVNVDNLTKIISNINKITSSNRTQLLQANRSNNLLNAQQRAFSAPYNSRLSGSSRGKNFAIDPKYASQQPTQQPSGGLLSKIGGFVTGAGSLRNKLIMGGIGAVGAGLAYYNRNTIKKYITTQPQQPGWYPPNIIPPNAPVPPHLRSWVPTTPNTPNVGGPGLLQGVPSNTPRGQPMLPPVGGAPGQPMLPPVSGYRGQPMLPPNSAPSGFPTGAPGQRAPNVRGITPNANRATPYTSSAPTVNASGIGPLPGKAPDLLKDIDPNQLKFLRAIGATESNWNSKEAYSERYNQPGNNSNVRKYGASGADYGYFQNNERQIREAVDKYGIPYEVARHLNGGGAGGKSTPEQQTHAMHQYLQKRWPALYEGVKSGDPNAIESARRAMAGTWFGMRDHWHKSHAQDALGGKVTPGMRSNNASELGPNSTLTDIKNARQQIETFLKDNPNDAKALSQLDAVKKHESDLQSRSVDQSLNGPTQVNRPNYWKSKITFGDQTYDFGTGSPRANGAPMQGGAVPFGTFSIKPGLHSGLNPDFQNNSFRVKDMFDPKWGRNRSHILFHSARDLDKLYSAGCFAIHPKQWPAFRAQMLSAMQKHGEMVVQVNPDGSAKIMPKSEYTGPVSQNKSTDQFIKDNGMLANGPQKGAGMLDPEPIKGPGMLDPEKGKGMLATGSGMLDPEKGNGMLDPEKGKGMLATGSGMLDPEKGNGMLDPEKARNSGPSVVDDGLLGNVDPKGNRYEPGSDAWIQKEKQYRRITKYSRQINEPGVYKYGGGSLAAQAAQAASRAALAAAKARDDLAAKAAESERQMPVPSVSIDPKQEYIDKSAIQEKIPAQQPEPTQQIVPSPAAPQPVDKEPEKKAETSGDTKNAWAPNVMEYWKQGKQGIHV